MSDSRVVTLLTAAIAAAGAIVSIPCIQAAETERTLVSPPADLHPPVKLDADALRARLQSNSLGLKPQSGAKGGIELPFGLNYHRETKSVVMPLDEKSEWGVGVGLNLNSSSTVELSPSTPLGLQPTNRAPGILLQKKF